MPSFFRSKLASVVLGVVAVWMLILAVAAGIRKHDSDAELQALLDRVEDGRRENDRLARQLEQMKLPQWTELAARKNLNYKQPGETAVIVYTAEKIDTIAQVQSVDAERSNWKLWLDWLLH